MNNEVAQLSPSEVWTWFEKLNAVPRPSKKEERIIAFVRAVGDELGFFTIVDDAGNVIIRKPATAGKENVTPVVLQAHLDMVHQKNADTDFDFDSQGIESWIDGEWVKAKGTTLGADNGMGAASILAVLSSTDIKHGPIEALFTIDEETGMTGAFELKSGLLEGKILLNTDTEDEGELTIGCAGGIDSSVQMPSRTQTATAGNWIKLSVTGLKGGHSGCEIHLGRGNANKIMNRILWTCQKDEKAEFQIASINGGSLRNAIPRESFAVLNVVGDSIQAFEEVVNEIAATIQNELAKTEPSLKVTIQSHDESDTVLDSKLQHQLLAAIYASPCGVIRMSDQVEGLVETSTNLSLVNIDSQKVSIEFLSRSSVESAKTDLTNQIDATFEIIGATTSHSGNYPGWTPNADSDILRLIKMIYIEMFSEEPTVNAVHAGLECGIIGSHYPELDMVSLGPTIKNPHSPDEKCHIPSVEKYWRYLIEILESIPEQS
jgi:dipeptidase D